MTYRFYFWFKGTDPNKKGGPWWVKDFSNRIPYICFRDTQLPFLHAWALEEGENLKPLRSYPDDNFPDVDISPPQNLQITFVKEI